MIDRNTAIEVWLAVGNAHIKNVPGRKSDEVDTTIVELVMINLYLLYPAS